LKPHEKKDASPTNTQSKLKQDNKSRAGEDAAVDENATIELLTKLRENSRFDFKLARQYKVEVIADAVARYWEQLDEEKKMLTSGFFIRATKYREDIGKNIDITKLRLMIADKIAELDQVNSVRIFASIITEPLKTTKPNEIDPRLSKYLYAHFFQADAQRYAKLFLNSNNSEALIVLQHLVTAVTCSDSRDPDFAAKQQQFLTTLIDSDVFTLLDTPTIHSLVGVMRAWPILMIADAIKVHEQFAAKFPDKSNPFASVLAALETTPIRGQHQLAQPATTAVKGNPQKTADSTEPRPTTDFTSQPIIPPAPEIAQRNFEDPREVISIVTECFKKLETDLASKQEEIEQLNAEKRHNAEIRDKKRVQFESLLEENRHLKEAIDTLKSDVKSEKSRLQAVQNENDRLCAELSSNEQKTAALVAKHEQAIEDLSNRIENISKHNINELKRGLEIDLIHEFNEIAHLPTDEACVFHMDLIDAIFRKLRGKGIDVGGGQQ
jgi:hypothetical protein